MEPRRLLLFKASFGEDRDTKKIQEGKAREDSFQDRQPTALPPLNIDAYSHLFPREKDRKTYGIFFQEGSVV